MAGAPRDTTGPPSLPAPVARRPIPVDVRKQLLLQRQRQAAVNQASAQGVGVQAAMAQQRIAQPVSPVDAGRNAAMNQLVASMMANASTMAANAIAAPPPATNVGGATSTVTGGNGYLSGTTLTLPDWYKPGLATWKGTTLNPAALAAYQKASQIFGKAIPVTDSYRSYQAQVDAYANKPDLAAPPGSSYHQLGLAIDVSGLTSQMAAALRAAGFKQLPSESWHWTYRLVG